MILDLKNVVFETLYIHWYNSNSFILLSEMKDFVS